MNALSLSCSQVSEENVCHCVTCPNRTLKGFGGGHVIDVLGHVDRPTHIRAANKDNKTLGRSLSTHLKIKLTKITSVIIISQI
ncbi:hypothetical protein L1887_36747 [Cichorium endivia]|nr:hypothetical protein L1887_36747 [Cichorium endivia]